jgi:hypothetical protein
MTNSKKLYCKVTKTLLNKISAEVERHVTGKKYQKKLSASPNAQSHFPFGGVHLTCHILIVEFQGRMNKSHKKSAAAVDENRDEADLDEALQFFEENEAGSNDEGEEAMEDGLVADEEEIPRAQPKKKRRADDDDDEMDVDEDEEDDEVEEDDDAMEDADVDAAAADEDDDEEDLVLQGDKYQRQMMLASIVAENESDEEGEGADLVDMDADRFFDDSDDDTPKKRKRTAAGVSGSKGKGKKSASALESSTKKVKVAEHQSAPSQKNQKKPATKKK